MIYGYDSNMNMLIMLILSDDRSQLYIGTVFYYTFYVQISVNDNGVYHNID